MQSEFYVHRACGYAVRALAAINSREQLFSDYLLNDYLAEMSHAIGRWEHYAV